MSRSPKKRPAPSTDTSSNASSSTQHLSQRSFRLPIFNSNLRFMVIEDKFEEGEKAFTDSLISKHGGRVTQRPEEADVIVTHLRGPKRMQRHLDRSHWSSKTFVKAEWVHDSVADEKQKPFEAYALVIDKPLPGSSPPAERPTPHPKQHKPRAQPTSHPAFPTYTQKELQDRYVNSNFACQRLSPLICINETLIRELDIIKQGRLLLDGNERSSLSYGRAIAAIKSYPWLITRQTKLREIKGIGEGVESKILEWLDSGKMSDAETYKSSAKLDQLRKLSQVYGLGAKNARKMHENGVTETEELPEDYNTAYLDDWAQKIPRVEVEEIAELVAEKLEEVRPGCEYTITGGYRRGKPASNDIDIVITHREEGKDKNLLKELLHGLKVEGILVDTIFQSHTGTNSVDGVQNFHGHLDPLDKAFCVLMPPKRGNLQQLHRRVDIIVAPYKYYYTAIVGWTGSTMFERDLRRWARQQGLKFWSGNVMNRLDSTELPAYSEEEVFQLLGLDYIPPNYRVADCQT